MKTRKKIMKINIKYFCLYFSILQMGNTHQYPDPYPATGGLVFEAGRKPKKKKIETTDDTEVPSNLDSTVVILNIPAHDTQKNKKSN
jgi:hypothetical protein